MIYALLIIPPFQLFAQTHIFCRGLCKYLVYRFKKDNNVREVTNNAIQSQVKTVHHLWDYLYDVHRYVRNGFMGDKERVNFECICCEHYSQITMIEIFMAI